MPFSSRSKQNRNLSSIGVGIVHGPSYISVYNYPVLFFNKRSISRGQTRKKTKRVETNSIGKNINNITKANNSNDDKNSKLMADNDPLDLIVSYKSHLPLTYYSGKQRWSSGSRHSKQSQSADKLHKQS